MEDNCNVQPIKKTYPLWGGDKNNLSFLSREKLVLGSAIIGGIFCLATTASAATFETTPFQILTVNSETPAAINKVFSSILVSGVLYKAEVSGVFTPDFAFGQRGEFWDVDARFVSGDNFATVNDTDPNFFDFDFGLFSTALGGDDDDFWGTYQASGVYSYEFFGTGSAIDFYVNDIDAASGFDNQGTFTVRLFREAVGTPEPSGAIGLSLLGLGFVAARWKRK